MEGPCKIPQNKYLTFSEVLVIGNHALNFQKIVKIEKKKLSDFFKIKILLCNLYAKITEM